MGNSSPIPILFGMGRVGSGLKREKKGRGMFISAQDKSLRTNKVHQENILDISEK